MEKQVARLLSPPQQKQKPLTRADAERRLTEVLGKGDKDLYARYVYKRTKVLSLSKIRLLVEIFTSGEQFEFEKTLERLFGGRSAEGIGGHPEAKLYDDNLFISR